MKSLLEWRRENLTEAIDSEQLLGSAIDSLAADPKANQAIQLAIKDDEVANELLTNYEQFVQQMGDKLNAQVVLAWLKQQANQPYISMARFKAASAGQKFGQQTNPAQMKVTQRGEVDPKRLGLTPYHKDVFQGSTADAPPAYKYVFVRMKNKYLHNPNYDPRYEN